MFHGRFRRVVGNLRINIGDPAKVKDIRRILLKSTWFSDIVSDSQVTNLPQGKRLLPLLPANAGAGKIRSALKDICAPLGPEGKAAIKAYVEACKQLRVACDRKDAEKAGAALAEAKRALGDYRVLAKIEPGEEGSFLARPFKILPRPRLDIIVGVVEAGDTIRPTDKRIKNDFIIRHEDREAAEPGSLVGFVGPRVYEAL